MPPIVSRAAPKLEPPRSHSDQQRPGSAEAEELDEPLEQGGFPAVDAKVPLSRGGAAADFCQQLFRQVELRGLESGVIGVHRNSFTWVSSPAARYGLATQTGVWKITASPGFDYVSASTYRERDSAWRQCARPQAVPPTVSASILSVG